MQKHWKTKHSLHLAAPQSVWAPLYMFVGLNHSDVLTVPRRNDFSDDLREADVDARRCGNAYKAKYLKLTSEEWTSQQIHPEVKPTMLKTNKRFRILVATSDICILLSLVCVSLPLLAVCGKFWRDKQTWGAVCLKASLQFLSCTSAASSWMKHSQRRSVILTVSVKSSREYEKGPTT